ncbi:MAG: tRNA lysidine(34) synthetase TilS [Bacteroidota bacterium]
MLDQFKSSIQKELSFLEGKRLLIAISGGVDSMVLTYLCHNQNLHITLAHCNFNLRGAESDADEAFVIELGEQLGVEVFTQGFDTSAYAESHKLSIQMAARELRYDWFQDLAHELHFDYILTAHHADDNLETFLINFLRGTGLNGLTGIPQVQGNVVRPLLSFSRNAIDAYAMSNQLQWREDSSNTSRKYLRNKLRHEVVPILKKINPELLQSFQQTISNLSDTADIVTESLKAVSKRAITSSDESQTTYKISEFKKVNNPRAYLFEMFKSYGFTEWNDVLGLLDAQSGKYVLSESHRLIKHRDHLILTPIHSECMRNHVVDADDNKVDIPMGTLYFENVNTEEYNSDTVIYVDKDKLHYPLQIRKREEGDMFYPFGMTGKKKLSKFFKDEKYSLVDKENAVLLCSEDDILWVVGKRADNRFRVTPNTKTILKITYEASR